MQIEDMLGVIKNDIHHQTNLNPITVDQVKRQKDTIGTIGVDEADSLRALSVDGSIYNKNELTQQDTAVDQLEEADAFGGDLRAQKNTMVLASETLSAEDYRAMEENGFSPMDMGKEIVTVADQIKLQLAKAGEDIDMMGGLSDSQIESMTGSIGYAKAIEASLSEADLPVSKDVVSEGAEALQKLSEMPEGTMSADAVKYMIKNELEPTIENVYKAVFSQTLGSTFKDSAHAAISDADWQALSDRVDEVIDASGRVDREEALNDARWLLEEGLPLTSSVLDLKKTLDEMELMIPEEEAVKRITEAVSEGSRPGQTYMAYGFSMHDIAAMAVDTINKATDTDADRVLAAGRSLTIESLRFSMNITSDAVSVSAEYSSVSASAEGIRAHKALQEARLLMTQEANLSLMKRGISIDTTDLATLVDKLDSLEKELNVPYPGVFEEAPDEETKAVSSSVNKWEMYITSNETIAEIRSLPAALLVNFDDVDKATLPDLQESGRQVAARYAAATERYDIMQTEVRKDLGDSLQKAFRNVDDILRDLDLEISAENQRAVRILAYNEQSITSDAVVAMRETDVRVSAMLRELTPGVVKELIDRGDNPLDLRVEQLVQKIGEIRSQMDSTSDEEGFASFLWKAEHANEITDEQRDSYIGIYRMLHQIEKTDGAVIGQLMLQGADITLRNLMGAVRTRKHENREYTVDDSFGELKETSGAALSITQQAEAAFMTQRSHDARMAMSPSKMGSFSSENEYLDMNPDQFAYAMEESAADETEEALYYSEKMNRMNEALASEDRIYRILRDFDIPITGANLEAMSSYMTDRNAAMRRLFGKNDNERRTFGSIENEGRQASISDILDDIIEEFGEAAKTPEDMAKAQKKLADIAENVMKTSLPVQNGSIDIRAMKSAAIQMRTLSDMAKRDETYAIPILVGDELGNLNLRIVRGKDDEKGLVDIVFNTDTVGSVGATFRYEDGGVNGEITSAKLATRELLSDHAGLLAQRISEESGLPATLSFGLSDAIEDGSFYDKDYGFENVKERSGISTQRLYGVARAFIKVLGEIG